jgi:hypothetical protein
MFTTLKGSALWAAALMVTAIIGAATYLASQRILSGSDWLVVAGTVLAGIVGVSAAHVTGAAVNAANQSSASGVVGPPDPPASPLAVTPNAGRSAMPNPGG